MQFKDQLVEIDRALNQNKIDEAKKLLEKIPLQDVTDANTLTCLGTMFSKIGSNNQGFKLINKAIDLDPLNSKYYYYQGQVLRESSYWEESQKAYQKAIDLNPNYIDAYHHLAVVLTEMGKVDEAFKIHQKILEIHPQNARAYFSLAGLSNMKSQKNEAIDFLKKSLECDSHYHTSKILLADLLVKNKTGESLKLINEVLEDEPCNVRALFAKAKICEVGQDFKEAYACYEKANALSDKKIFNRSQFLNQCDEIEKILLQLPNVNQKESVNLDYPVYLVGVPRCGSSLLAQILDSHSGFYSEGENNMMDLVTQKIGEYFNAELNPKQILEKLCFHLNEELKNKLTNTYHQHLNHFESKQKNLTPVDKTLNNGTKQALLSLVAPQAAIIHILRDARDVAFSNWTQDFMQYTWFSHDLEDALVFCNQTSKIIRLMNQKFKNPYLEIFYEKLIENPEIEIQKICDFLKIDFEKNMLNPEKNERVVVTASNQQVKEKISKSQKGYQDKYPEAYEKLNKLV